MRAVKTGDAPLFWNAQFAVQLGDSRYFGIHKTARLHFDAIPGTDLDHKGARCNERCQAGVVEVVQHVEVEHVECIFVEQERRAFGEIGCLEVPVIKIAAAHNCLETSLGGAGPKGGKSAVGQAVEGESILVDER